MSFLYNITQSNKQKYIWFHTAKCGTRSILNFLTTKTDVSFTKRVKSVGKHWHKYFKFAIVRNPWDRLVSAYQNKIIENHQSGLMSWRDNTKSFTHFILKVNEVDVDTADPHICSLSSRFPREMDYIGRFENLQDDFNIICDKLGFPEEELPHRNKSEHTHYSEYYNDLTRRIVARKYAKDIELFNYKFKE